MDCILMLLKYITWRYMSYRLDCCYNHLLKKQLENKKRLEINFVRNIYKQELIKSKRWTDYGRKH